jgi:hypothetical protein
MYPCRRGRARFPEQLVKLPKEKYNNDNDRSQPPTLIQFKMRFPLLAASLALVGFSTAHNIQLKAHSRECFHEQLHADDKMTVTFQVGDREFGGSGNLDIDFWVYSH